VDHGEPIAMVGSLNTNLWGNPPFPGYEGFTFDPDHEGHWGWEANEILNGRPGEGRLADWLLSYAPDIVLMHLGTNDVLRGSTTASTVTDLEAIIGVLQADNPDVSILLARVIPSTDPAAGGIPSLNAEMDGIALRNATARSRIAVVDQYDGFVAATDLHDPWHPNAAGEEKMAVKWMQALAAGPLARLHLRWDAGGATLRWDLPVSATESRLYQGVVAALVDGDGSGVPDAGYGSCLAVLPGAADSFQPAAQPAPGEIIFHLVEIESMGSIWGLGRAGDGAIRLPTAPCP
jgi:hypothetical protein